MKIIIEKAISTLQKVTDKLQIAYIETYGDAKLAQEFNSQAKIIKEYNKQRFIAEMATRYAKKMKNDGLMVIPELAFREGERIFNEAKMSGDIDCMNNLIPPEED